MNKLKIVSIVLAVALVLSAGIGALFFSESLALGQQKSYVNTKLEMSSLLTRMQFQVNAELEKLDSSLTAACQQLSATGLGGDHARTVLSQLAANNSLIVNAGIAGVNDVLVAVEPNQYSDVEGLNVSGQEEYIRLHATMRPAMSDIFPLVEGFDGVVLVAPIFDGNGTFVGALSLVIDPYVLLNSTAAVAVKGTPYAFWAMQMDGRIIYDVDRPEVGKMLFTDPSYVDFAELLAFGRQMVGERAGYSSYSFYKNLSLGQVVQKEAFWTTVGVYGVEWRLVLMYEHA